MALAEQLGAPKQVIITSPALTFDDLVDAEYNFGAEILEHFNGNNHFPRINIGSLDVQIKFTTTDIRALQLGMGQRVTGVTIEFKPTVTAVNPATGALTSAAGVISYVISDMQVNEPVVVSNDSSKAPAQFAVSLKAVMTAAGADPTITSNITLGV